MSILHANPSSLLRSIIFILIFLFLNMKWVCWRNRGSFPVPARSLILYENTAISRFSSKQKHGEEPVSCAKHSAVLQQLEQQRCWCVLQRPQGFKMVILQRGRERLYESGRKWLFNSLIETTSFFFSLNLLSGLLIVFIFRNACSSFIFFFQNKTGPIFYTSTCHFLDKGLIFAPGFQCLGISACL